MTRDDDVMREHEEAFRFEFFEVVGIVGTPGTDGDAIGTVLGRSRDDDGVEWYALAVEGREEVFSIEGARLQSTGKHRPREDFYDGSAVRVTVEGEILDDL